jgi:hypothetical protein
MARISVRKWYSPLIGLVEALNQLDADGNSPGCKGFFLQGSLYSGEYGRSIARMALKSLRLLAKQEREPWKESGRDRRARTQPMSLEIDAILKLYIDAEGLIQTGEDFFLDHFLPALKGKEVLRLRICPMCNRLFVAIRKDQPCCEGKCNNLRWTHKSRGKLPPPDRKDSPTNPDRAICPVCTKKALGAKRISLDGQAAMRYEHPGEMGLNGKIEERFHVVAIQEK